MTLAEFEARRQFANTPAGRIAYVESVQAQQPVSSRQNA
jgi:hypothetical protein